MAASDAHRLFLHILLYRSELRVSSRKSFGVKDDIKCDVHSISQTSSLSRSDPPEKPEGVSPVFLVISRQNLTQFPGKNTNGIPGFCVLVCASVFVYWGVCTETKTPSPNLINAAMQTVVDSLTLNCRCCSTVYQLFSLQQFIPTNFHANAAGYSSKFFLIKWIKHKLSEICKCKLCRRFHKWFIQICRPPSWFRTVGLIAEHSTGTMLLFLKPPKQPSKISTCSGYSFPATAHCTLYTNVHHLYINIKLVRGYAKKSNDLSGWNCVFTTSKIKYF